MALSRRQKRERAQAAADMRAMLDAPFGRRFINMVIGMGGVYHRNPGTGAAETSALFEGRRSVALDLMQMLSAVDPYAVPILMREDIDQSKRLDTQPSEPDDDKGDEE